MSETIVSASAAQERYYNVLVRIVKGKVDRTYRVVRCRPAALYEHEAKAYLFHKSDGTGSYRIVEQHDGQACCDCPGWKSYQTCKHVDFARAFGLVITAEHALMAHQVVVDVAALETERDAMRQELQVTRGELHDAREKLDELDALRAELQAVQAQAAQRKAGPRRRRQSAA